MKLMHCPFCGETELFKVTNDYFSMSATLTTARVRCVTCGAHGPIAESSRKTTADLAAVQGWNNRLEHAEDLALRVAFTMLPD